MVKSTILNTIKNYVKCLGDEGVAVEFVVLFGSQARGTAHQWSDIDIIVVSPQFDNLHDRFYVDLLWRVAARVDSAIEPLPCGVQQWRDDVDSAIIEIARRNGEILPAA